MVGLNKRVKQVNYIALALVLITIVLVLSPVPDDLSLGFVILTVACSTYLAGLTTAKQFVQRDKTAQNRQIEQ